MPVQRGRASIFIDPGSPWQNAWIESFNGRLRDELLNGWHFDSLLEAKVLIEDWRIDYNINRPHSAHGDLTPDEFARAWTDRTPTSTRIDRWTTQRGPLKGRAKWVYLPQNGDEKVGLDDYLICGRYESDLLRLARHPVLSVSMTDQLHKRTLAAITGLHVANDPPILFQRADALVEIQRTA